jgi:DNA-binding transcriptional ArsR family regulator
MSLPRPITEAVAERVGRRLEVLAHPVRIRLVDALDRGGEVSVSSLADEVGVSVYDASQHLALLRRAGVIRARRQGRLRCYRLDDPSALAIYEQVADRLREQITEARSQLSPERATADNTPSDAG